MGKSSFAVACVALAAAVGVLAQDAPGTERPESKVGDTWSYDWVNRAGGWLDVRREVKSVSADSLTIVVTDDAGISEPQGTPEFNLVRGEGKPVVRPHTQLISFPLTVGRQWKVESEGVNASGRDDTADGNCAVLSLEEVSAKVGAAGSFKVDRDVEFCRYGARPIRGRNRYVDWYAPTLGGEARAGRLTRDGSTGVYDGTPELASTTVKG